MSSSNSKEFKVVSPGAAGIEVRMLYDGAQGERTVFLGRVAQISDAAAGLKSAVAEVRLHAGTNLRVEARDTTGAVIYAAKVREEA